MINLNINLRRKNELKRLKKFFSLILGVCTLFTSIPNAFAGDSEDGEETPLVSKYKNLIDVAVVGDDDVGKLNLINGYTNERDEIYKGVESFVKIYENSRIRFFNIPSDLGAENKSQKKWIENFLEGSRKHIFTPRCSYVIICLNVENSKEDLVSRTYDWLKDIKSRNKHHQIQVVLYSITKENVRNYIDKINAVTAKVCDFEGEFMDEHKDVYQFRSTSSYPGGKSSIIDEIIRGSSLYIKKNKSSDCSSTCINVALVCGGVGLTLVLISGIILGIVYLCSK